MVALLAAGAAPAHRAADDPFSGLATWVDIYDGPVYSNPEGTAARIAARGVRTVFAETANYKARSTSSVRLHSGGSSTHCRRGGSRVVAWYLPGFDKPGRDLRRTRAMLTFRTPNGGAFDGVALDVEATIERRVSVRTTRLVNLASGCRRGGRHTGGAITLPPRMLERRPTVWPGFPWASLAEQVDTFVPMAYTGRRSVATRRRTGTWPVAGIAVGIEGGTETPIHAAGGVADRMTADELRAFVDAASEQASRASASTTSRPQGRVAGRRSRFRRLVESGIALFERSRDGRSGRLPRNPAARGSDSDICPACVTSVGVPRAVASSARAATNAR